MVGVPLRLGSPDLPSEMLMTSALQTVNHNTKKFRFALPTAHHVLGLPVGKEVWSGLLCLVFQQGVPLPGSPETRCFSLVPPHSTPLSPPGLGPPGCAVPPGCGFCAPKHL